MTDVADAPTPPDQDPPTSLFDRTLLGLRRRLQDVASGARIPFIGTGDDPDLEKESSRERLKAQMQACIEARGGEVVARGEAAALAQTYLGLGALGRRRFFEILAHAFATDRSGVDDAIAAYGAAGDDAARLAAEAALRSALTAPRVRLLTQLNALPGAIKFLVDMRADLLPHIDGDPWLRALDQEFRGLLETWFDIGFLRLERITWESPAALLEKLIAYEAVHEIRSWRDLRSRLDHDRRLYAFFHPAMPDEPLIFVEVALLSGIADSIQALLDERGPDLDPADADTAIFYSISNTQRGLAGIGFGNFLIKQVVDDLVRDLPKLRQFATLSPIPGLRAWLERSSESLAGLASDADRRALSEAGLGEDWVSALLADGVRLDDDAVRQAVTRPLLQAAAHYLVARNGQGRPIDPVARFHLGNGARIERLNAFADTSEAGMRQSVGVMVNYRYERGEIEQNHEAYATDRTITVSPALADLLKGLDKEARQLIRVRGRRSALGRIVGS